MSDVIISSVTSDRFTMDYARFGHGDRAHVIIPGVSVKSVMPFAEAVEQMHARYLDDCTFYLFDRKRDVEEGYDTSAMADDTAEAMRLLGIDKADLRGVSQGGMIAEYIAARHPDAETSLCLCSTLCRQNDVSRDTFTEWVRLAKAGDGSALVRDINNHVYSDEYRYRYRDAFASTECGVTADDTRRFAILAEACLTHDASSDIGKITCPTFAVGAGDDRVLSVEGTKDIAKRLGCDMYIYEHASHAVYDEAKDYTDRIMNFCLSKGKEAAK